MAFKSVWRPKAAVVPSKNVKYRSELVSPPLKPNSSAPW